VRAAKKANTLSRVHRRLVEPIETDQDNEARLAFQHTVFCQTGLPYRNPGDDVRLWQPAPGYTDNGINDTASGNTSYTSGSPSAPVAAIIANAGISAGVTPGVTQILRPGLECLRRSAPFLAQPHEGVTQMCGLKYGSPALPNAPTRTTCAENWSG
jgi:hypothetical protein